MERVEEVPAGLVDAGGPRTAAAEQGHAAAHSCGSLRGHACGGGADPQYQRQTAGATVDAPTAARRVGHARRLVPTPAHAAKVHKPAWASTQKRGQLPMRWSSESGKKTCSQVDASTEAGFMHSYVVGHIGLDPSQPSILRNGDRGRRESSRQVTTLIDAMRRGDLPSCAYNLLRIVRGKTWHFHCAVDRVGWCGGAAATGRAKAL